jgi:DNA-directed RNA polymerase specialized sigma24 family protein
MTPNTTSSGGLPIIPLRLRKVDGSAYSRPPEIEATLLVLSVLPGSELVERARINDSEHPNYLPSECVLYFVRYPPGEDTNTHNELFKVLRQRVLVAIPVMSRKVSGSGKPTENAVELDIREAVLHKFQVLLCKDRKDYEEGLDFYECRFNAALASLRATARRDIRREAARFEPLESETDPTEPSPEVEKALMQLSEPAAPDSCDFLYRSKLLRAISLLPVKEQRVIELLLQGFPIDSKDDGEQTIAKILDCAEKTVRNRRDRALLKLRNALNDEKENA